MVHIRRRRGTTGRPVAHGPKWLVLVIVDEVAYCTSSYYPEQELDCLRRDAILGTAPVGKHHEAWCQFWRGRWCNCDGELERLPAGRPDEWAAQYIDLKERT